MASARNARMTGDERFVDLNMTEVGRRLTATVQMVPTSLGRQYIEAHYEEAEARKIGRHSFVRGSRGCDKCGKPRDHAVHLRR